MNQTYLETARLLTQVAPLVFADDTFALKGGTAINLFVLQHDPGRSTSANQRVPCASVYTLGEARLSNAIRWPGRSRDKIVCAKGESAAQAALLAEMEIPVVSLEDMYGGKLVAALDHA